MSAKTWKIDPMHSEIQFKVKHLMISTVTGSFTEYDSNLSHQGEDFSDAKITFKAGTSSITTGNEQRDGHLKTGDFFDTEKFPELSFESTSLSKVEGEKYKLDGNLTIKGNTKPVQLDVEFGGIGKDGYGQTKAGFEITGTIHRADFGIDYDPTGAVLSPDIKLLANVQFTQQA